ncbi:MAG: 5'/3'-nucleotidase SurE [Candidatus Magnetobacterium sp. LHC-1]|uniref:5'-nucleotidase SurE n=1 Tax=Candidatus Magnetobacterium casense TaxID=1455061 RepID=A0ABS6RW53_9BACT|nr:5'/3'-nucleotidase SurE [Candidatus Magnetobacterium casensis]MBF0607117.1 5'/3'-nucleotidase SurE [Nitrospirota bacterium]MBV6340023.1 5'/3'-nucleotidase SurE [Candidatus Magnetobacterium casensis]
MDKSTTPLILVTNDDGVSSPGIVALHRAMKEIAESIIVAPDRERSATSHSLTMHRPLRVSEVEQDIYCVNGTPTDCVAIAVQKVVDRPAALLVSGINMGGNLGDDITYSGTVSAAIEGTIMGVTSFAISMVGSGGYHFDTAASFAGKLARIILDKGLPKDTLLNVNLPNLPEADIKGVKFTKQGKRLYIGSIHETFDPWGRRHYWIGGGTPSWEDDINTDYLAVESGYISITPIHLDLTNYEALDCLRRQWREVFD